MLAALIRVYAVFPEETIEAIDEEGQDSQVKTVANKMCIKFQSSCSSDVDMLLSQVNILLSEINVKLSSCREVNVNQLLPRVGNILSEMEFVVKLSQMENDDTSTNEVDDVIVCRNS